MPSFDEMFMQSKGQPILYQEKTLMLIDRVPADIGQKFLVTIESTNSKYPQGVGVSENVAVFGEKVKRAVVWEYFSLPPSERNQRISSLPFSFVVECRNKQGFISFYNIAEVEGRQEWWSGGSCMWVEDIEGGRRYHCNDFARDDDFDDIIFSVSALAPNNSLQARRP